MVLKTGESGVLELHRQTQSNTCEHRTSRAIFGGYRKPASGKCAYGPSSAPIPSASAHGPSSAPIPSASAYGPSSAPIPSASAYGPSSAPILSAPGPSSAPVLTGGGLQRKRNSNNGFACEKCGKVLENLKDLNAHMKRKKHGKALRQKGNVRV
ncbi:hypothetical protein BDZ89DRAFT_1050384 [Hymenopellis radicata]|nr:hypothetical protein BDZ89DRAFT_1050384 [Hymenopellis radicata]